jgi:hypothetical protein
LYRVLYYKEKTGATEGRDSCWFWIKMDQKDTKRYKLASVRLSDFERLHIVEGFGEEIRNDGRT